MSDKKGLYFIPLGGSEQFGANLNVYNCDGEILAIDCGLGFADERFPGIDLLLPDPTYLEDRKDNLQGLVITHAHEDHIGAVARLWKRFKCQIYTTQFTAAVLREKFKEEGLRKVPVHIIDQNDTVQIGSFKVQFVPVAHSVPDTAALIIDTPHGKIIHSGDWNLDPKPIVGSPTDEKTLKAAGEQGVLAYIGDSTNAGVRGRAGSESEVEAGLEKEFAACKGKIAVTMFSSNIGRMISIVRAAAKVNRSVCVVGRSMHRMIGCAIDCGYMNDIPDFVDEDDLSYIPDEKQLIICTGSQGEYRAALAKIARGDFRSVKLKQGDTVIFSARAIPGNDRNINQVKNNLAAAKVTVISPNDTKNTIHVSGHPCQDEITDMLQWVKPNTVIPVHGERTQLDDHAEIAKQCQIPNVIIPKNGSVIKLAPGTPKTIDHIETGLLAVDQKRIINANHRSITERRKIQYTGIAHFSVVIDHSNRVQDLSLTTIGLIDEKNPGELQIEDNLYDELRDILDDANKQDLANNDFIEDAMRVGIRRFVSNILGMKPKTTIHVIRI